MPHWPQFDVSVVVVTHELLQLVVPEGQLVVQVPPAHTAFVPHALEHPPQLAVSDCSLTQALPHML
jgi:hypothetical protein